MAYSIDPAPGRVLAIDVDASGIEHHILFHLVLLVIASSLILSWASRQSVERVAGVTLAGSLAVAAMLIETAAFMPVLRFLLRSMSCVAGRAVVLPDASCRGGGHLYYTLVAPLALVALVGASIHSHLRTSDGIERAKRGHYFAVAPHFPYYFIHMVAVKVLFVLPASLLHDELSARVASLIMLLQVVAGLVLLLRHQPYYNGGAAVSFFTLMAVAVQHNLVAALIAFTPSSGNEVLAAYLWGLLPTCAASLLLSGHHAALRVASDLEEQLHLATAPAAGRQPAAVDLSRVLLGLSHSALAKVVDHLRQSPVARLRLRSNRLTPSALMQLAGPLLGSSRTSLEELDLEGNKGFFETDPADPSRRISLHTGGIDVFLASFTRLRVLNLRKVTVPVQSLQGVCNAAPGSALDSLCLEECGLSSEHAIPLVSLLKADVVTELLLRYNSLGKDGATTLASALPDAHKLVRLDLGWNDIGLEGAAVIVSAIRRFMSLNIDCNMIPRQEWARIRSRIPSAAGHSWLDTEVKETSMGMIERRSEAAARAAAAMGGQSIYEYVGGDAGVRSLVDTFYLYLVTDPKISSYFTNISMSRMRYMQASFIGMVLGSDRAHRGRSMRASHAHLAITNDIYDQTVTWFLAAFLKQAPSAPQSVVDAFVAIIESFRSEIVSELA